MSRSEFRFNKRRKHYAYLFKDIKSLRKFLLFSTKPTRIKHGKKKKNIKLFKHPNPKCTKEIYVIPYVYLDNIAVFSDEILNWQFDKNDKRIIKRLKKRKIK